MNRISGVALSICLCFSANAATFTVTSTNDSGAGTFRQAILDANGAAGADVIEFNLPAATRTISPTTVLPTITDPVTINATTQPGFVDKPIVELAGNLTPTAASDGLKINTSNSVLRGLVLNRHKGDAIEITGAGNAVEGCIIGLNAAGAAASANVQNGINLNGATNTRIGGTTAAQRNVIAGNSFSGVLIDGAAAQSNVVEGNYIGTDWGGTLDLGNGQDGIRLNGAPNNTVGGTAAGAGNVISGNTQEGVEITGAGATNNVVAGNKIGTEVTGATALGNSTYGVQMISGASRNQIGGTAAGAGNVIAFNGGSLFDGVYVNGGTNNTIRANSIFSNSGMGIDLEPNNGTANDNGDGDTGANQLQNSPVLISAVANPADTTVRGRLNSVANSSFEVDFYSNTALDAAGGEGRQYLGSTTVNTDASGNVTFEATLSGVATGKFITATATDAVGNTSEFCLGINTASTVAGLTLTVTNTNDVGAGSLRQAILDANATFGLHTINFNIPGDGPHTISPLTALPAILNSVVIDGYTQTGAGGNSDANAFIGTLKIILNGTPAPAPADGLSVQWPGCSIRGLNIILFKGDGIEITAAGGSCKVEGCLIGIGLDNTDQGNIGSGVLINNSIENIIGGTTPLVRNVISGNNNAGVFVDAAGAQRNLIQGNIIGAGATGLVKVGNSVDGVRINLGSSNVVGGAVEGAGNLISGNTGSGVVFNGASATNNLVLGNIIGPDVTGNVGLRNTSYGVVVGNASFNKVGGVGAGEANVIAFNDQDGVFVSGLTSVNNVIRGNSIRENTGQGIDLDPTGVLANDTGDGDTGANQRQNYPVLTSAVGHAANTVVAGTLNSGTNIIYTLDFYSSAAADSTGNGEGQQYLGSTQVTTDGSGNASFNVTLATVATGKYISATATDPNGNTSEFSANALAPSTVPGPTFTVTTTADSGVGSLRQAILDANAAFSSNTIAFNIAGAGPHVIAPATVLPGISNTVTIDGYTQAGAVMNTDATGFNGTLKIVLNGATPLSADGLSVQWPSVTIRGLNITGFKSATGDGIEFGPTSANGVVEGCLIGIGQDDSDQGNLASGIYINNSSGHRIGGTAPGQRNVISGNAFAGVWIGGGAGTAQNNTVLGNLIGTTRSGLGKVENGQDGVRIDATPNNTIGGTAAGARNLIAGNVQEGVEISGLAATNNIVQGNTIGGSVTMTNNSHGIVISLSARFNVIGGLAAGAANIISYNNGDGVYVSGGTNNSVRANLIRDNSGLGIDLDLNGITPNDVGDGDTGSNQRQNFPVLATALASPVNTAITGSLSSGTNITYEIDFYSNTAADGTGNGEGQQYLGSTTVTTDATGNAPINATLTTLAVGKFICATATDPFGNTSEMGPCVTATSTVAGSTFTVTTTADSGAGSLRQAILDANQLFTSSDTIVFNIPGAGPHTNSPVTALPAITDAVTIDGYTQPGSAINTSATAFNGTLKIVLNGTTAPASVDGLSVQWPNVKIRGLNIVLFKGDGIEVGSIASNCVIEGCMIGWSLENGDLGNTLEGIVLNGAANALIGGTGAGARNVISGNNRHGIQITGATAATNRVTGNLIGTGLNGTEDGGNNQDGVNINTGAHDNLVGGGRNVLSGNGNEGVEINGTATTRNVVAGNYVGTDVTGATGINNGTHGVSLNNAPGNQVGGVGAGEGNRIAFNSQDGVTVVGTATNNTIRANSIVSNGNHGIDLANNGVTANDAGDVDIGANQLQNYPVLMAATANTATTVVQGTMNGKASTRYELDFFSSQFPENDGVFEGNKYLGSGEVTTDASGNGVFNVMLNSVVNGRFITATATDPDKNTSEFSTYVRAESTIPPPTLLVINTNDAGAGSLRQALVESVNYFPGEPVKINFQIPGAGPHYIAPLTELPAPAEAVAIDGYTQTGATANTLANGNNAALKIVLVGTNLFFNTGLRVTNSGNIFRGLSIVDFREAGIRINGNSNRVEGCFLGLAPDGTSRGNSYGVQVEPLNGLGGRENIIGGATAAARNVLSANSNYGVFFNTGSSSNTVQGNYIGVNPAGTEARANQSSGVLAFNSPGNLIGGTTTATRNLISGNNGAAVNISDPGSVGNRVFGNYLGTDLTGVSAIPNVNGVYIGNSPKTVIGGVTSGEGNLVAFNISDGIQISGFSAQTNNTVRGNSIFNNGALGINLEFSGVTENDLGDADEGTNRRQNFPELTSAHATLSNISIAGTLNSVSNRVYTIDFYANALADPSGNGEGQQYLGSTTVTTGADGNAPINVTLPAVIQGRYISATATDPDGNTSEFSDAFEATTTFPAETFVVTNTNDSGAGSLREAIRRNNASIAGVNNIVNFNIPGAGLHLITLASHLDSITHSVTINGYTQPGAIANTLAVGDNAVLKIQLDGTFFQGLRVLAPHSIIRGLSLTRTSSGVQVEANDTVIAGCFIGLFPEGTNTLSNSTVGVNILSGTNTLIGGAAAADRNVISGNSHIGIQGTASSAGTRILGNYIGTSPSGLESRANQSYDIYLSGSNHVIGGSAPGAGNLISGTSHKIMLFGATDCKVQGNYIGPDVTGTATFFGGFGNGIDLSAGASGNLIGGGLPGEGNLISGNSGIGVNISGGGGTLSSSNRVAGNFIGTDKTGTAALANGTGVLVTGEANRIGGTETEGNLIAFNSIAGVTITGNVSTNNPIRRNRITSNAGPGIDLLGNNVTLNDATDEDVGPNQLQNYPVITSASLGVSDTTVSGSLQSAPNQSFQVDVFANVKADSFPNGEGQQYLGTTVVNTDATGQGTFSQTFPKIAVGRYITATATDSNDNTSEFSVSFKAGSTRPPPTLLVTNTNDSGAGSLRQALINADGFFSSGPNKIHFNIPGAGPHVISVASLLPSSVEPVEIDGFTQPNSAVNTGVETDNAIRLVQLDGGGMVTFIEDGLRLLTSGNIVRGLIISQFPNHGIYIQGASNNVVEGNLIISNSASGIFLSSATSSLIGGSQARARNLILGNQTGISVAVNSLDDRILGNFIGVDGTGTNGSTILQGHGVRIVQGTNIVIGGIAPGEANSIQFNTRGLTVSAGLSVTMRGNRISANSALGIDLGFNNLTANDVGDADTGPNNYQNFPALQSANVTLNGTRMIGSLNSLPGTVYTLDFYWNATCDTSGNGEGFRYLGSTNVTTDVSGNANFDRVIPVQSPRGVITVTATDPFGNTSEFSACTAVGTEIPPQTYLVTNTNDSGPGSLRQAILDANSAFTTGPNSINFNIAGSGVKTISPTTPLPALTSPQAMNGYSQPGAQPNSSTNTINAILLIQLDGALLDTNLVVNGLTITANDCLVRGLIITRFSGAGVSVEGANNVNVTENLIGTLIAPFAGEMETQPVKKGKKATAATWTNPGTGNGIGIKVVTGNNFSTTPTGPDRFGNVLRYNKGEGALFDRSQNSKLERAVVMGNAWGVDPRRGGARFEGAIVPIIDTSFFTGNGGHEAHFTRATTGATGGGAIIRHSWFTGGAGDEPAGDAPARDGTKAALIPPFIEELLFGGAFFDGTSFSDIEDNSFCGLCGPGLTLWGPVSGSFQRVFANKFTDNEGPAFYAWRVFSVDFGGTTPEQRNLVRGNRGGGFVGDFFGVRLFNNLFGPLDAIYNENENSMPASTDIRGVETNPGVPNSLFDFIASFLTTSSSLAGTSYFYEYDPILQVMTPFGSAPGQLADGSFSSRLQFMGSPGRRTIGVMNVANNGDSSPIRFGSLNGLTVDTSITKTGPSTVPLNGLATFKISLTLNPNSLLPFVVVNALDLIPDNMEFADLEFSDLANPGNSPFIAGYRVGAAGTSEYGLGFFFIPGTDTVIRYDVRMRATALGAFNNVVNIANTSAPDPSSGNNESSAAGTVVPGVNGTDLGIGAFSFNRNNVYPGAFVIGSGTIQNFGNQPATGVKAIFEENTDLQVYQADTPLQGENPSGTYTFPLPDIAAGSSAQFNLFTVARTAGTKSYTVRVTSTESDANSANNSSGGGITVINPPPEGAFDFGDAPDTYFTLNASGGPKHLIVVGGPVMGVAGNIDAEVDGLPTPRAIGDDFNNFNDERGINFRTPLMPGSMATVEVFSTKAAWLDFWIDLNGDGVFTEATERMRDPGGFFAGWSTLLGAGQNVIDFMVPAGTPPPSWTFARFRLSSQGFLSPWGYAEDGEVEDHRVLVADALPDFGDAPDSPVEPRYPTLFLNDGAVHVREPGFFLGQVIDFEANGQPDANALGDDLNPSPDDEDGVTFTTPLRKGQSASVRVVVSVAGAIPARLDAWIDFNADFDWNDGGEKIFSNMTLPAGENILSYNVPADAVAGTTYARFRLSHQGNLSPGGLATSGEVEDYMVTIDATVTQPRLNFTFVSKILTLSWTGNFVVQTAPTPLGPWTTQTWTSPHQFSPTGANTFFRLISTP